jgi:hypothetical protein
MWKNFVAPDSGFRLFAMDPNAVLPSALKAADGSDIGINIAKTKLVGPSSAFLGEHVEGSAAVSVSAFTLAFFGVWETVSFAQDAAPKTLARLYAETPRRHRNHRAQAGLQERLPGGGAGRRRPHLLLER